MSKIIRSEDSSYWLPVTRPQPPPAVSHCLSSQRRSGPFNISLRTESWETHGRSTDNTPVSAQFKFRIRPKNYPGWQNYLWIDFQTIWRNDKSSKNSQSFWFMGPPFNKPNFNYQSYNSLPLYMDAITDKSFVWLQVPLTQNLVIRAKYWALTVLAYWQVLYPVFFERCFVILDNPWSILS